MATLYTLGYATWRVADVRERTKDLAALLVDVRFKPRTGKSGFSERRRPRP